MADSDGFPIDVQRAIEHLAALVMQCVDLETSQNVESLLAGARLRFEAALSAANRARNARKSTAFSVPNELWVATWSHLSLEDRITVSHVCYAWREVALSAPAFWTEIIPAYRYTFASETNYWWCEQCDSVELPVTVPSPLAFIRTLLDRSGGLPVCARVSTFYDMTHPEYMRDLGRLLKQYESRLGELHIDVGAQSYFAFNLLNKLRKLSSLRKLTISVLEDDIRVSNRIFKGKHEFRALESLDLSQGLSLGLPLELPRLHTLSLAVYSHSDLTMALSNCPALQSLRIIVHFEPDIPWDAALLTRLSTIRDVCIDRMQESHALWFAKTDMPAPGQRIRLVHPGDVPSGASLCVLREFADPIHAISTVSALRYHSYVVELFDASRTLVLEWPMSRGVFRRVWDFVGPTSIEAEPSALPALLSRLPPSVRRLTLRLHSADDVRQIARGPVVHSWDTTFHTVFQPAGFPALTELVLRTTQPGIELRVESITALREQLHLPERVRLLRISGVRVLGDARQLGYMAEKIMYGTS